MFADMLFCFFSLLYGFSFSEIRRNFTWHRELGRLNIEFIPLFGRVKWIVVFNCAKMGDHFDLLVDRLLTESTLEAAIESRNRAMQAASSEVTSAAVDHSLLKMGIKCSGKLAECRICHDDDDDSNMETPCSCCGSLKVSSILACL